MATLAGMVLPHWSCPSGRRGRISRSRKVEGAQQHLRFLHFQQWLLLLGHLFQHVSAVFIVIPPKRKPIVPEKPSNF
jgi:hypothetical protein